MIWGSRFLNGIYTASSEGSGRVLRRFRRINLEAKSWSIMILMPFTVVNSQPEHRSSLIRIPTFWFSVST